MKLSMKLGIEVVSAIDKNTVLARMRNRHE